MVNEFKVGYNRPKTSAMAFGPAGYDPTRLAVGHVHVVVDRRPRHDRHRPQRPADPRDQHASTNGRLVFDPRSISLSNALTWTAGAHTFKFGGEYRHIESDFQFLGSTEITYNSINDFIDNRPAQVAVALDSPVFTPQQFYADRLRAGLLARRPTG